MKTIDGGVTSARGFRAASTAAGIKYEGRTDMAMIVSDMPCTAAGTFTSNLVKAAPVLWDRDIVTNGGQAQAVVINAGIANACTGEEGFACCRETADEVRKQFGFDESQVLVASTGVIGMQIPTDRIRAGIRAMKPDLSDSREAGHAAACAIMTTDTKPKEAAVTFNANGKTITVGGMSKGSGMIHPNMCTMLAFVTTDLNISKELLDEAVKNDVVDTFNMISVDGDTSTNDTLLVLANGAAGNEPVTEKNEVYEKFCEALHQVNETLAKKMAGDGEGATALFEVRIVGAETKQQARILSKAVIGSNLTKAAIFGHDANWGRILCAMGYSGAEFDPDCVDLFFESSAGKIQILKDGRALNYSEEQATEILAQPEVAAVADLHMGSESATAWGCDLTYDYVKINADYRS